MVEVLDGALLDEPSEDDDELVSLLEPEPSPEPAPEVEEELFEADVDERLSVL